MGSYLDIYREVTLPLIKEKAVREGNMSVLKALRNRKVPLLTKDELNRAKKKNKNRKAKTK